MNMRKAAHPSGGMGSSNPRRWRGERLHHHGDGVCHVVCAFCVVSDSWLGSGTRCTYNLEVLQVAHPGLHYTYGVHHQPVGYLHWNEIYFRDEELKLHHSNHVRRCFLHSLLLISRKNNKHHCTEAMLSIVFSPSEDSWHMRAWLACPTMEDLEMWGLGCGGTCLLTGIPLWLQICEHLNY